MQQCPHVYDAKLYKTSQNIMMLQNHPQLVESWGVEKKKGKNFLASSGGLSLWAGFTRSKVPLLDGTFTWPKILTLNVTLILTQTMKPQNLNWGWSST